MLMESNSDVKISYRMPAIKVNRKNKKARHDGLFLIRFRTFALFVAAGEFSDKREERQIHRDDDRADGDA